MVNVDRLAFVVEWTDAVSGVTWKYQLMVYPQSQEVELFDVKNRRTFLRKTKVPDMKTELYYVGSKTTILGRQLHIIDYADAFTQKTLSTLQQRTLLLLPAAALKDAGVVMHAIEAQKLLISKLRMCELSASEAQAAGSSAPCAAAAAAAGRALAVEVMGCNAVEAALQLTASAQPLELSAQQLSTKPACAALHQRLYVSGAPDAAGQDCAFLFGAQQLGACGAGVAKTLAIIKPHIIAAGSAGMVLHELLQHFHVECMAMFNLDRAAAGEFLEVYRGVVAPSEFTGGVDELSSGPCTALALASMDGSCALEPFRQLCGPQDPEVARLLRPKSLRARYGVDKNKNAVHCTDLEEDGPLEISYFFGLLQPV